MSGFQIENYQEEPVRDIALLSGYPITTVPIMGFWASLLLGILFGKKDIQVKQLMVFVYEDQKLMRSFLRNQCLNMTFNQQKTVSGLRRLLYQQNAKMRWTEASFFFQTVSLLKLNFIPMHLLCEHRIPWHHRVIWRFSFRKQKLSLACWMRMSNSGVFLCMSPVGQMFL